MGCKWYLAMTGAEFLQFDGTYPAAWMSARFSSGHTGLSNLPDGLPEGSLLIIDDFTPFADHDPERIARDAARAAEGCEGILLDFQRQWDSRTVAEAILQHTPCPVAISAQHAEGLPCAVFLSPDLNIPLSRAVQPWQGRELWLDVPVGMQTFQIDAQGCQISPILPAEGSFPESGEFYRYRIEKSPNAVVFSLYRGPEMLTQILEAAASLGITKAVGLEQEYKKK